MSITSDCKILIFDRVLLVLSSKFGKLTFASSIVDTVQKKLFKTAGPSCSKLTTSLVNDSLKFQTLISQICQYFLLKKK